MSAAVLPLFGERPKPAAPPAPPPALRPYQVEAVEATREELRANRGTLILLATGLGKTQCAAELIRTWPGRCLFIAHRTELIEQAARRIEQFTGEKPQIEKADDRADPHGGRHVVASVQTLSRPRRLERFDPNEFGLIIVDEVHHGVARSYRTILDYFTGAKLVGLTATPDRADSEALGQILDSVAYRYEIAEAINDGWLSPIRIRSVAVDAIDFTGIHTIGGDFNQGELDAVMAQEEALHGVAKPAVELTEKRPTIVFTTSVANAHRLAEIIDRYAGPESAVAVDGGMPVDDRKRALRMYESGARRFLINVGIATEGYDHPPTSCVVMGRPTKSRALYCLSMDTEILTPEGWKGHGGSFGDAYIFDTATSEIRRGAVLAKLERDREDGERWVRYGGPHIDFSVTDQHRMIWRERFGRAHRRSPWGIGMAMEMAQRPDAIEVPVSGWEASPGVGASDDEMRFVGIVMTDGTIGRTNRQITITQSATSPVLGEIRRVLQSVGVKFTESVTDRRGKGNNFEPTAPTVRFTVSFGAARGRDKHRTGWGALVVAPLLRKEWSPALESVSARELRCLLDGMHVGDGAKSRRFGWKIASARRETIDRLQSLCLRRGLHANVLPAAGRCVYLSVEDVTSRTVPTSRSGRPTVRVEGGASHERVWCIETDGGTIITRRGGRALIMGQCQMLGRGTRGGSLCPIPGKTDCLVLDFKGNAARHSVMSAVDALAGDISEQGIEAVREVIESSTGDKPLSMDEALVEARKRWLDRKNAELAAAARRRDVVADVAYRSFDANPYVMLDVRRDFGAERYGWAPATDAQMGSLQKQLGKDFARLPSNLGKTEASRLLGRLAQRREAGLASAKQVALLGKNGVDAKKMLFATATAVIDAIKNNGWRPLSDGKVRDIVRRSVPPGADADG